jgi:hypothetical protein
MMVVTAAAVLVRATDTVFRLAQHHKSRGIFNRATRAFEKNSVAGEVRGKE